MFFNQSIWNSHFLIWINFHECGQAKKQSFCFPSSVNGNPIPSEIFLLFLILLQFGIENGTYLDILDF